MSDRLVVTFIGAVICALIGQAMGRPKGRRGQGLALGFFLGVIGLVIMYFLKPQPARANTPGGVQVSNDPVPGQTAWMPGGLHAVGAQWAPDPTGRPQQRWWNGTAWTDQVLNDATVRSDPL